MLSIRQTPLASAIALACFAMSPVALADADVQGRIVDARGNLISGAEITIPELKLSRTTEADGRFYFKKLPVGSYTLKISYLGSIAQKTPIQITDQAIKLGDVKLQAATTSLEHIEVVGQSGAISKALNRQRNSAGIVTVASTDEMGQFPDSNVGETLQRLAGLSVERDQGEGRFVRVRGLAPDYNAVTYNGTQLAAPEAGRRAVALDVIPSDLLESVEVSKTMAPDMAAGSLGGTIEIKSLSAFDRSRDFYSMTAEGGYNNLTSETSPKLSGVYSSIFDINGEPETLGVAIAASYANRKFGSENVETGGKWDVEEGLEEFELRDYQITRERAGLAFNVDYHPGNNNEYYLRTLYSEFSDEEARQGLATEFDQAQFSGNTGEAEIIRSLKQRKESQSISAFVLGTRQVVGRWEWVLEAGASKADEDTPFNIAGADFAQGIAAGVGYENDKIPMLIAPTSAYDAMQYELKEIEMGDTYTKENEHNVKLDITREFMLSEGSLQLKGGVKLSERNKMAEESVWIFEDFDDVGVTQLALSDYSQGNVESDLSKFGAAIDSGAIYQLVQGLDRNDFVDEVESSINDYKVDENINSGYFMAHVEYENWQLISGLRYEHDQRDAAGVRYDDTAEVFSVNQQSYDKGYLLPALISRYNLSEQSIIRASYSTGLVRPTFEQLAPAYLLEEDDGEFEASFGNPTLKALTSQNFDIGFEHYADDLGVLSAMVFYKKINNFIYQADLAGRGEYSDFKTAETYINGGAANLYGIEFNAVHKLSGYGNWLDNWLVSANMTFTDSGADIEWADDGDLLSREIALPSQSDKTANLSLGYETPTLSVRLAANFKSDYLAEVGDITDAAYDVHSDNHLQFDFTSKYQVAKGMQLYFNAVNLNDEPYYAYTGTKPYNFQYEQYGRTFVFGMQITNW